MTEEAIAKAVGEELRIARETLGWSRTFMVSRLPSGIGDRTLLSYEHGMRQITVFRLIELSEAVGLASSSVLAMALQRARVDLANLELIVDLRSLLADFSPQFRPLHQWAKNKGNQCPDGIARIPPAAIDELATFMGCTPRDLVLHLTKFTPDYVAEVVNGRAQRGLLKVPD
ncbi:helix-turn-helix domain-containing protein [Actinophytocola sp. NPDC049390]|uniref:helix-turn-helix domain-containing protein n=1 Tax=Actinophytocola sp. NPDC049390 TaxID=3363894 RepID=UPI00379F1937